MSKRALRKDMLTMLGNMSAATRRAKAAQACDFLFSSAEWTQAVIIAIFVSIKNEFPTRSIIERAWEDGKLVAVPKILDFQTRAMAFLPIKAWSDLRPGYHGIMEPVFGNPVQFSGADLMLLPGLAFDKQGWRLGYGGGYYDRFLAAARQKPNLFGLCFSEQIIDAAPHDSRDMPVDGICSDAGMERVGNDIF